MTAHHWKEGQAFNPTTEKEELENDHGRVCAAWLMLGINGDVCGENQFHTLENTDPASVQNT